MSQLDILGNLRDDERRQRTEARLDALQEQIDRLRGEVHASDSRQARAEAHQQALAELDQRLEARTRPLPDLQAQVAELARQVRTRLKELAQDRERFDGLQEQLDRLPPQLVRNAEIANDTRAQLAGVREEIEAVREGVQRAVDTIKRIEQEVARRAGETLARLDETDVRIAAVKDELPPLDVQLGRVRHELQGLAPRFDTLAAADAALKEEFERAAARDFDRHVQTSARLDEARAGVEERLRGIERLNDTRFGSTMTRFGEFEEADQALGHRLTLLALRLDELRDQDARLRAEMHQLESLRVRVRLDQAQREAATLGERLRQLQAGATGEVEDGAPEAAGEREQRRATG